MSKRFKAQRTFGYVNAAGEEVIVAEGEIVAEEDLSESKLSDLIIDGLVKETRAKGD